MKKEEPMMMIVERDDVIIPSSSPNPRERKRPARFLSPCLSDSSFDLPISASFRQPIVDDFSGGWTNPLKNWSEWVDKLRPLYAPTWLNAGIHDAILISTFSIPPFKNLILALVENWCPLTNTFVFPFGEATLALDDVAGIGGYPLSGSTVRIEDNIKGVQGCCGAGEVIRELEKARDMMSKSASKKATVHAWTRHFMGRGGDAEHAAFLVLWLSRHVFPFASDTVGRHLIALASRLAEGVRVALAPAVLASLYRDLTLLKQTKNGVVRVCSPLILVQVWGWERFPNLRPIIGTPYEGNLRMGRWERAVIKGFELSNVRAEIEAGCESFIWRPYVEDERCWQLDKMYPEKDKWVSVCPGMREDFKSFAKIVRVSELVGIDCIQPYFPHRVSRQFGFDQDIPGRVARFDQTPEIAWRNYDRLIRDEKLYIPSRSFCSGVTSRYLEWWNQSKLVQKGKKSVVAKGKNRMKRKTMTDLLGETHIQTSPRTKKKKTIVEDAHTLNKKLKADKFASSSKDGNKANKSRKRKRNGKQRLERSDVDKSPADCISSSGAELPMETENKKQRLKIGNENADNSNLSLCAELQNELGNNDKQRIEVKSLKEIENDELGLERIDENEIPQDDVQTECRIETAEVIAFSRHDEAENKVCNKVSENSISRREDDGKRNTDSDRLFNTCDGNDVRMEFLVEPLKLCENKIIRCDENVAEVPVEGRVRFVGYGGDSVNKNKTKAETSVNRLRMVRALPLEARILRLEIILARLKEEMISKRNKK